MELICFIGLKYKYCISIYIIIFLSFSPSRKGNLPNIISVFNGFMLVFFYWKYFFIRTNCFPSKDRILFLIYDRSVVFCVRGEYACFHLTTSFIFEKNYFLRVLTLYDINHSYFSYQRQCYMTFLKLYKLTFFKRLNEIVCTFLKILKP